MNRQTFTLVLTLMVSSMSILGCQKVERVDYDFTYERSEWPLKTQAGTKIETDHYRVYTTSKDEQFQEAVIKLAESQYQRFNAMIPQDPKGKMTVYIFSNTRQWMAFTQSKFPPAVARLYFRIRNGGYASQDFAAFYYMGRYPTLTIMAHELFHLYLNQVRGSQPVPAWVNEGLACYFEAHEWDDFDPVFTPTKNLFRRQNLSDAVASNKLFSLKELLSTDAGKVCANDQGRMLTYYAQLWGLMQFLQNPDSGYYERFHAMLAQLGMPETTMRVKGYLTTCPVGEKVGFGEGMFRVFITEDLECFESQLNEYLRKLVDL
jgi:hypothetical protein